MNGAFENNQRTSNNQSCGGKRPGAGRKKGMPNKLTAERIQPGSPHFSWMQIFPE
jgi:hypothetical protein